MRLLCWLVLLLLASAASGDDFSVLISFKSSIERDPIGVLSTWNPRSSSSSLCSWTGITCSDRGRVEVLDLSGAGLVGRLRLDALITIETLTTLKLSNNSFYGNLTGAGGGGGLPSCGGLESIDLAANNFTEPISEALFASCSRMRSIDLSGNRIPGDGLLKSSLSNCRSLTTLNFSGNQLTGKLDGIFTAPCENLQVLDLSNNSYSGEIPSSFVSQLPSLKHLDLSRNNFSGDFSAYDFGECGNLTVVNFSFNALAGRRGFPASFANCGQLEKLDISRNSIGGKIPTFWQSFRNLRQLALAKNQFSGGIPPELGQTCSTLSELDISDNRLVGGIPSTFVGCPFLVRLDLGQNQLSGEFLQTVVSTMPRLKHLSLSFNNITGQIPQSLSNCTGLEVIDLSSNELVGNIPSGLCSSLTSLQKLLLANNFLSGPIPEQLGSCRNLSTIDFSFNEFNGSIPEQIWSLPQLSDLVIWANRLSGEISDSLCINGARNLESLILNNNFLTGSIPPSLAQCTSLIWVSLSNNHLTGRIPLGLGKLRSLAIFQLGNNSLTGEVPSELGECKNLIWLDLNSNNLAGPVPPELANQAGRIVPGLVSGKQFAFVRNEGGTACRGAGGLVEFEGIRTGRLEKFPMVHSCPSTRIYTGMTVYSFQSNNGSMIYLDLSYNALSGTIPENFGSMFYLQVLNLGHNRLTGSIPDSFGGLKQVGVLDLSHNQLEGFVPGSLGTLTFLSDLDVSNNNLTGAIPSSGQLTTFPASRYENNSGLCGVPLLPCRSGDRNHDNEGSGRRKQSMAGSVVIGIAVALLFIFALSLTLFKMRSNQKAEEQKEQYVESLPTSGSNSWKLSGVLEPLSINVATFEKPLRKLTFAHLLEATNGFSAESLIGSGGFGEVYKARLKDGCVVAIKKLVRVTGQGDREFTAEMETIGKIKHRNLVPLLGYCKVGEERLLVYEYMKWGSLETVLHERKAKGGGSKLDWAARKKIAIGSARGLAFLHHSCIPHIIHRDMKSSNVLLDENLEARVSDFGMARLMNALDTHLSVSTLAGTPGYVPPEYYQSFRCTTKGDVYSYGVVLLELLSGKRPIDPNEFGDNNLVGWAKQLVREKKAIEIFDPELTGSKSGEAELYQYLKIACECLDDRPLRRPTMIQVMAMFKELQIDSESDILDGFSLKEIIIDESREKEP